jgi:Short C-terminal domain
MFRTIILALTLTLSFNIVYSQQLVNEDTYKAKNGMTFKTGDELVLGYGSNFNKDFRYVVTGLNSMAGPMQGIGAPWHSKKFKIKKIKEMGNEKRGKTYYLVIGAGLMNFWVDAEAAMEFEEIIYPEEYKPKKTEVPQQTPTTSVADEILKLKKLLDDGILTKEEFEIQKKKILEKSGN